MSQFARVDSIDVIKHFRVAMWKFAEASNVALGDAESEITRTLNWLENEQLSFWESQIRSRWRCGGQKAQEAVRHKKLFKTAINPNPSTHEEEKALRLAQKRFAEAQMKLANTKKHVRQLRKGISALQRIGAAICDGDRERYSGGGVAAGPDGDRSFTRMSPWGRRWNM